MALLFTLQAPLTSGVCSSLQGPFCKEVNGLSPPRRVLDDAWPGKGGGAGASLKEVNAKLLAALRSLKPRKIIAAFEMHGSMVARTGRVELSAGAWLGKAPKGWITVGLKGVLAASGKLLLRATDEQGVNMEGCSEMTLLRRRPRGGGGNAAAKIAGTWAGSYSCHGVPTKLELELQRDGGGGGGGGGGGSAAAAASAKSVPLLGTFSFRAKSQAKLRDLLDGELGLEGLVGGRGLPRATPARRRATRAGCSCAMNWRRGSKLLRGGVCAAAPPDGTAGGEWCVVDEATCAEGQQPAGKDEDTGVAWDFCVPNPQDEEGAAGQAAAGQAGKSWERLPTPPAQGQGQAAAAAARTGKKEESERRRHPQQLKPSKRKPQKKPKLKKKKPAPAAAAKKKVKKQKKKAKAPVNKKKAKVPVNKKKAKMKKKKKKKKKSSRKGAR